MFNSAHNMNNMKSEKYGLFPEDIEIDHFLVKDSDIFSICIG